MSEVDDAGRGGDQADLDATDDARSALEDLPDGSGCTEIWDHMSERRRSE